MTKQSRVVSLPDQEICLSFRAVRPALGSTQYPIQWAQEVLSSEENRPGCESDYLCPSNAKFNIALSYMRKF
jgi:hypothetical protein